MSLRGLFLAVAFAALSALAGAVTQDLKFDGTTLGDNHTNTGNVWILGMSQSEDAYIGELTFTDVTDANATMYTLCASISETLDSSTHLYNGLTTQDVGDIFTAPNGKAQISPGGLELAGAIVQASGLGWGSSGTANEWASMQVAIWSALYNGNNGVGGFSANGPDFKVTMNSGSISGAGADYNAGVALLAADPGAASYWYQYQVLDSNPWAGTLAGQDQLAPSSEFNPQIGLTPGPAAVLPFALGLLRRRRRGCSA